MMTNTDIQKSATEAITNKLNRLLADYQVIYAHLHALHWNVEGRQFFVAHRELETMYDQLAEFIDDVAERILTLGQRPATTLKEYVEMSELDELASRKYEGDEVAKLVLKDL
ncbi:MAG: Dps family protein, partial [Alkalispirochaetaceae bacterium]